MSRKTTITIPDELYEKVVAISKYYNKSSSSIMNVALELLFANLPKVNYMDFSRHLLSDTDNKR